MENTKQIEAWSGEFGDAYTARNQVTWWNRVPFWADVMARTRPTEVLEVGCNAGWNLMAIRATGFRVPMRGIDVNRGAIALATEARLDAVVGTVHDVVSRYELVFTAGVLIHVAPDQVLEEVMKAIVDRSQSLGARDRVRGPETKRRSRTAARRGCSGSGRSAAIYVAHGLGSSTRGMRQASTAARRGSWRSARDAPSHRRDAARLRHPGTDVLFPVGDAR
jgi:hypothetical protein